MLLPGCAAVLETDRQAVPQAAETVAIDQPAPETASEKPAEPSHRAFPEEVLYQLLVADIALIRGQFDWLWKNICSRRQTRDGCYEMANRIPDQGEQGCHP